MQVAQDYMHTLLCDPQLAVQLAGSRQAKVARTNYEYILVSEAMKAVAQRVVALQDEPLYDLPATAGNGPVTRSGAKKGRTP